MMLFWIFVTHLASRLAAAAVPYDSSSLSASQIDVAWLTQLVAPDFDNISAANTMGALLYGLEVVENDASLLPGYTFS